MQTFHPYVHHTFLAFSLWLFGAPQKLHTTSHEEATPVQEAMPLKEVAPVVAEAKVSTQQPVPSKKVKPPTTRAVHKRTKHYAMLSNEASWTVLLAVSAFVYWMLRWHGKKYSLARSLSAWFMWPYYTLAKPFCLLVGLDMGTSPQDLSRTYPKLNIALTMCIVNIPFLLLHVYESLRAWLAREAIQQWLGEVVPGLAVYLQRLQGDEADEEGAEGDHLVLGLGLLVSFAIGTFAFVPYLMLGFKGFDPLHGNAGFLNAAESFVCGLLGMVVVPILFYVPTFVIALPGLYLTYRRWPLFGDEEEGVSAKATRVGIPVVLRMLVTMGLGMLGYVATPDGA